MLINLEELKLVVIDDTQLQIATEGEYISEDGRARYFESKG